MQTSKWAERLEMRRKGKDRFFRDHPQSPLPHRSRKGFRGLCYYPLDPAYRFELSLEEHPRKKALRVKATHGGERELIRWGRFRFSLGGGTRLLQAYRTEASAQALFVPFRDQTSGQETYALGRYLDLEPEIHRVDKDRWILDFNEAYNPWCDYSDDFVCPIPPNENWLEIPVRAGEKKFTL